MSLAVGYTWGERCPDLSGEGVEEIDGLTTTAVGASSIDASGNVCHPKNVQDFAGSCAGVTTAAATGGGVGLTNMRRERRPLRSETRSVCEKSARGSSRSPSREVLALHRNKASAPRVPVGGGDGTHAAWPLDLCHLGFAAPGHLVHVFRSQSVGRTWRAAASGPRFQIVTRTRISSGDS